VRGMSAAQVEKREDQQSENCHRHAAGRQAADDSPIDGVYVAVHERAETLRNSGVEQVRADRRYRVYAKQIGSAMAS